MCHKLWKLASSRQSYCKNNQAYFFGPPCILLVHYVYVYKAIKLFSHSFLFIPANYHPLQNVSNFPTVSTVTYGAIHTWSGLDDPLPRYNYSKFSKWPPAGILDLIHPEIALFYLQSLKPHQDPNMMGLEWTAAEIWPLEMFQCVRSVVSRSVVNIHTSYTDVIYSSLQRRNAAHQE